SSVVICASPRLFARRLAGSIVRHSTRRPRIAACTASEAAVVVLPTPPHPTQTTTRCLDNSSSRLMVERVLAGRRRGRSVLSERAVLRGARRAGYDNVLHHRIS